MAGKPSHGYVGRGRPATGQRSVPVVAPRRDVNAAAREARDAARENDPGYQRCSVCDQLVAVRADGQLRGHKVGRRPNNWHCPGSGSLTTD